MSTPGPDDKTIAREEADFQRDLKCLPERRRRAFLRYMQRLQLSMSYCLCVTAPTLPLHCLCLSGSEDGGEDVAEDAREKLNSLLEKYGRDSNDFDLGDLGEDFDDLDVNSDSEDEDSE